jgi:DNA-binding transcriptional ArsR family regulator
MRGCAASSANATITAEGSPLSEWCAARYISSVMSDILDIATVAALIGDPARANMLCALLDGRARTAGELAYSARVSPQTASGHLGKLAGAKLVEVMQQGRHRYYRLAGPHVGGLLEGIMAVAAVTTPRSRPIRVEENLRQARLCYDHLAGRLGVALADSLQAQGHVAFACDGGAVTAAGETFLRDFGIDMHALPPRRVFCKPCLDWSERRPHVGGSVGAALAERLFALGWIRRKREGRALLVTPAGLQGLQRTFGVTLADAKTADAAGARETETFAPA